MILLSPIKLKEKPTKNQNQHQDLKSKDHLKGFKLLKTIFSNQIPIKIKRIKMLRNWRKSGNKMEKQKLSHEKIKIKKTNKT